MTLAVVASLLLGDELEGEFSGMCLRRFVTSDLIYIGARVSRRIHSKRQLGFASKGSHILRRDCVEKRFEPLCSQN